MSQRDFEEVPGEHGDFPYDSWERVYRESGLHELPWNTLDAHPLLVAMLGDHHANPGSRALDLGCGTGASSRLLAQLGYEVDAWDVSETAISRARSLSKAYGNAVRFHVGNCIRHAMCCGEFYELVLDFLFLHHVQDRDVQAYFSGVRKSLSADGRYLVGVLIQTDEVVKEPSDFSDGDVRYWTLEGIEQCLGADFRCILAKFGRAGNAADNYACGVFMFLRNPDSD